MTRFHRHNSLSRRSLSLAWILCLVALIGRLSAQTIDQATPTKISLEGGIEITFRGAGFQVGDILEIGGQAISNPEVTPSLVTGLSPAGVPEGWHDVVVVRGDMIVATLPSGIDVAPTHTLESVTPNEVEAHTGPTVLVDAADANDDGMYDISDALYLLGFLFLGKEPPASPLPGCGMDFTLDTFVTSTYPGDCGTQ